MKETTRAVSGERALPVGAATVLHLGHEKSVKFDLFSAHPADPATLRAALHLPEKGTIFSPRCRARDLCMSPEPARPLPNLNAPLFAARQVRHHAGPGAE